MEASNSMTEDESAYWRRIVEDLQEVMPISRIAESLEEDDRIVWKWRAGTRPTGWSAIGLFLLHVKHCPERQRQIGRIAVEQKTA